MPAPVDASSLFPLATLFADWHVGPNGIADGCSHCYNLQQNGQGITDFTGHCFRHFDRISAIALDLAIKKFVCFQCKIGFDKSSSMLRHIKSKHCLGNEELPDIHGNRERNIQQVAAQQQNRNIQGERPIMDQILGHFNTGQAGQAEHLFRQLYADRQIWI